MEFDLVWSIDVVTRYLYLRYFLFIYNFNIKVPLLKIPYCEQRRFMLRSVFHFRD
jgi:hypothetical protein